MLALRCTCGFICSDWNKAIRHICDTDIPGVHEVTRLHIWDEK